MPSLTRENIKEHCRTCLQKLKCEDTNSREFLSTSNDQLKNSKICVNIENNEEIKQLIRAYMGDIWADDDATSVKPEEYPQHICITCHTKFKSYEKFRKQVKQSGQKLQALLCRNVNKIEIGDDEDDEDLQMEVDAEADGIATSTLMPNSTDIYKFLVKDLLMEPETVMLDTVNAPTTTSTIETPFPDPFEPAIPAPKEDKEDSRSSDEWPDDNKFSETEDSEDEFLFALVKKGDSKFPKRSLRSDNKPLTKTKSGKQQDKVANNEKVAKRRNRGTRNSLKCEKCNKRFSHKITLDAHIRQVHEGCKRPFKCDRCENSYALLGGLYTHIKEIHEAEVRSYTCGIDGCDRNYTNSKSLERHKRTKHCDTPVVRKYVCEQCGATFNQTANLRYHRRTKHPTEAQQAEKAMKDQIKERYECEVCKKLFHSRYTLNYHNLQFHLKEMNFECNVCGKKVAKKFMLDQHMLVHSTNRIPCDVCGREFVRKFELDKHIKAVHMKLKPFECQYCHESFAIRKTLKHHEYTHTGEKPYVCDICGTAYRQQSCLKNHRKTHGIQGGVSKGSNVQTTNFTTPTPTPPTTTNADFSNTVVVSTISESISNSISDSITNTINATISDSISNNMSDSITNTINEVVLVKF